MKKEQKLASGIVIGLLFGTVVGVLTNNIGLWLGVGIAIGDGVGNSIQKKVMLKMNNLKKLNQHQFRNNLLSYFFVHHFYNFIFSIA